MPLTLRITNGAGRALGVQPVMVFDDANLENAVNTVIAGVFAGSSGQSCVSP